jgi:YesN/AraC family two-component response regulator
MLRGLSHTIRELVPDADVAAFENGNGALGYVRENGCDILISEIELCGISGLTLAQEIKQMNPRVNIIFLTVCDEREHAREVLRIKPSGYLVKPVEQDQLESELKNLRYHAS